MQCTNHFTGLPYLIFSVTLCVCDLNKSIAPTQDLCAHTVWCLFTECGVVGLIFALSISELCNCVSLYSIHTHTFAFLCVFCGWVLADCCSYGPSVLPHVKHVRVGEEGGGGRRWFAETGVAWSLPGTLTEVMNAFISSPRRQGCLLGGWAASANQKAVWGTHHKWTLKPAPNVGSLGRHDPWL